MYSYMKKLINKKYYPTAEDAQERLDVFYAKGRLTTEQYEELTELVNSVYTEEVEE